MSFTGHIKRIENLRYRKGTKVLCPKCNDHIANLAFDVFAEDPITEGMFRWVNQLFSCRDPMVCKKCGAPWFDKDFKKVEYVK